MAKPRRVQRGALALLLLAACAIATAGESFIHLRHALTADSASVDWTPPPSLDQADTGDAALLAALDRWQAVDLPHARAYRFLDKLRRTPVTDSAPQVTWYRLWLPKAALSASSNHLYLPRWQSVGTLAVYVDGRLAWRSRGDRAWTHFNHPLWLDLGELLDSQSGDAIVHLRMATQPGSGSALSSLWAGSTAELAPSRRWRNFVQTELVSYWRGSFLMLGLFSLAMAVWLRYAKRQREPGLNHEEKPFLLFFAMAAAQTLAGLLYLISGDALDMDFSWFSWMTLAALFSVTACGFHFLCRVQRHPRPRLARALNGYTVAAIGVALPWWWPAHSAAMPMLRVLLLPAVLLVVWVTLADAWRLRNRPSFLLAAWGVLLLPMAWHDLAMQAHRLDVEGIYLTPYANVGLLTLFLYLAFTRYVTALDTAARARLVLTERLAAQERELVQTHERLRSIERDQTLMQERQRLMRDMHDGVGSSLMSALRLVEGKRGEVNVAQVLRECIDDLKIAIDSLEPAEADLLSLLGALRFRLGRRLSDAGIALQWRMNDLPALPWLDAQAGLHVLRILQELFTNIAKHSGASRISVSTDESPSPTGDGSAGVRVRVEDNGKPFLPPPPDSLEPGRRGLANVQSRMRALGARGGWHRHDDGTVFSLWLPLRRPDSD